MTLLKEYLSKIWSVTDHWDPTACSTSSSSVWFCCSWWCLHKDMPSCYNLVHLTFASRSSYTTLMKYHKDVPSPEESDLPECQSWKKSSTCCTHDLTVALNQSKTVGLYNFTHDLCGSLSPECAQYLRVCKIAQRYLACWWLIKLSLYKVNILAFTIIL